MAMSAQPAKSAAADSAQVLRDFDMKVVSLLVVRSPAVFGDVHGFCGIGGYGVPFKSEELPIGFRNQTDVAPWRVRRS